MSKIGVIYDACDLLYKSNALSYDYIDSLRDEMVNAHRLWTEKRRRFYCYLAFFGSASTAHFLKVGISATPRARIAGFACGNPLQNTFSMAAECPSQAGARLIEQSTLRHLAAQRVEGEWVRLGEMDERAALNLVAEIERVSGVKFNPIEGYRHGDR